MPKKTLSKPKQNSPQLWLGQIKWPDDNSNKYTRGQVLILGGPVMIGAARLCAMGARRAGAGLVHIAVGESSFDNYVSVCDPGIIISPFAGIAGFKNVISQKPKDVIVLGPGAGTDVGGVGTADLVLAAISSGKAVVVDADGINAFKDNPEILFSAIKASPALVILTPHSGEFERLFPNMAKSEKIEMTVRAAQQSGAVVVFKGANTVIAGPDGDVIDSPISSQTSWLATAGSGDVLAGIIAAMVANGMDGVSACGAAVWMQARSAMLFGPGLVAEDIAETLPSVWAELALLARSNKA